MADQTALTDLKELIRPPMFLIIILCILFALVGYCMSENMHEEPSYTMFKIIQASSYEGIEYEVNIRLKDGWHLHEGLQSFAYPDPSSQSGVSIQVTQIIAK